MFSAALVALWKGSFDRAALKSWAADKGIPIYGLTTRAHGSDGQWYDVPDREGGAGGVRVETSGGVLEVVKYAIMRDRPGYAFCNSKPTAQRAW